MTQIEPSCLTEHALAIWQAGVDAVRSDRLVQNSIQVEAASLCIGGELWTPSPKARLCVVGGGKAGAGMVTGLESVLGESWLARTCGWVNVPADCVSSTRAVHLHAARPAGMNEPTLEGQQGTERILELVSGLGPDDLCLVLISGGGSALLPAPCEGLTLADKQAVTRLLMNSGATIGELNLVRRNLSRIKGGGLLRSCRAGKTISLIISDVIGDPLDVIASGPTVPTHPDPAGALAVLKKYDPARISIPASVWSFLESQQDKSSGPADSVEERWVTNRIIGNNQTAILAAKCQAEELGYQVLETESHRAGVAREVGRELAEWGLANRQPGRKLCRLSGGEPVVHLASGNHQRKGGRNQELVLAAVETLWDSPQGIVLLSGGTDGEDGPTDAAGAVVDESLVARARDLNCIPATYLNINNSYPFFEATGGLLKTGPTHTNVMDVRVVLVDSQSHAES